VTIRDEYGEFQLSVKRSDDTKNIYARAAKHRSLLKLGDEILLLTECMGNYDIKNGSVIDNVLRHQFRPQMAMGSDEFQIFVKTIPDVVEGHKETLVLVVKASDTILSLKNKFLDKICTNDIFKQHQDVRIIFQGVQLVNNVTILSDIGICADDTIIALPRLLGGAKKGCKKQTKRERMHALVAKVHYSTTQTPMAHPSVSGLCQSICVEDYIPTRIANMSLAEITALDDVAQECKRSTVLIKTITPELIPEYKQLELQKAAIENSLAVIQEAMDLAMTQTYWKDACGIDTNPFYEAVSERRAALELEAEVSRRVSAVGLRDRDVAM
jgi:hypothetical protein